MGSPRGARPARSARRTRWRSSRAHSGTWTNMATASRLATKFRVTGRCPPPGAARAAELAPLLRGLASTDRPQVGHYTDDAVVLDFLARSKHPALAALGTSCPDHFLRTKIAPLVLDLPAAAPLADVAGRLHELHAAYREAYRGYYERHTTPDSPPMRGADPAIVLVPGVGMFSFGADKQTARVAGEFYVN